MNEMLEEAYKVMFTEYGDVVTPKEVAKMLGIGMKSTYALLQNGAIPKIPCGRAIKVAKLSVIKYVLQSAQYIA